MIIMEMDTFLRWTHRIAMIGFMLGVAIAFVLPDVMVGLLIAIFFMYIFLGVGYVNNLNKNGLNKDRVTLQICMIILGTVLLMVMEVMIFKFLGVLKNY